MSLFTVKDTWITKVNNGTELQNAADIIHVGSLLSEDELACQIIHASSDGTLTIYFPNDVCAEQSGSTAISNEPPCVVHKYEEPILKVLTGRFSPENPQQTYLAMLLPSKLVVSQLYDNRASGDCSETIPVYLSINTVFEVTFTADMFNMCCGLLFEEDSYESICIQAIDSVLHIYSGATHVASARIPNTLLPGPLVYSNCYHSVITATSSRAISCYKAEDILENYLSHSTQKQGCCELLQTDAPSGVAMAMASWSIVVGEPVFQMEVLESFDKVRQSSPRTFIIALCRESILLLCGTGQQLGVKHLQLTPKVICPIGIGTSPPTDTEEPVTSQPKFCVATEEKHLLVFQGLQLVWSAKLLWSPVDMSMPFSPHAATRENLPIIGRNSVPGLIALLGPESQLTLSYLGTSPPTGIGFTNLHKNKGVHNKSLRPGFLTRQEQSLSQELSELNRRIKRLMEEKGNQTVHMEKLENYSKKADKGDIHIKASVSSDSTQTYFLDVSVQFSKNSRLASNEPMSLVIHSCPPIAVVPNYLTLPATNSQKARMPQKSTDTEKFYHNCRLLVNIDSENPVTRLTPQDLNVRLVLGYWLQESDPKSNDIRQVFDECCVKLPLNLVFSGKSCEKQDVAGLYQLKFDITEAINPLNWNLILPTFALEDYIGPSFCLWRSASYNNEREDEYPIDTQRLYITLNFANRRLKLRTSSADMLWPVLNDIHTRLANTFENCSTLFTEEPLLHLESSPCTVDIPLSFRCTSILPNIMVQLNPLVDCLFRTLQLHLEARFQMATLAAEHTIQSRHFRMVQKHVLERIKDNIPAKLNGFDTLLERSICVLIEGCDQALNASLQQVFYGILAVSLITLLGFISDNCIRKSCSAGHSRKFTSIFQVGQLQAVIQATEMLETIRGYSTIPGGQNGEDDVDSTKPPPIGLEEYLCLTMQKLLGNTEEKDNGENEKLSQELKKNHIPDLGWIIKMVQMLCCKFAGHQVGTPKLPKISASELSPDKNEPEKTMET